MSNLRSYGAFTKLSRVVEIGGRRFTHAVRFDGWPDVPTDLRIVTSGVFDEDTPTGASSGKTVYARRGLVSSSYIGIGSPPPDVPFSFLAGTNVVAAHEAWSHVWHNSLAVTGGRTFNRAVRGDVGVWQGRHFLIASCEACASPGRNGVEWQEGVFPGRAPIMAGTRNLATPESTNVNENYLNHRDVLVWVDLRGELAGIEGQAFDIARRPRFHPLFQPSFVWAVRGLDWQSFNLAEDGYLLAEEGILLLDEEFAASIPAGERVCFDPRGKAFRQVSRAVTQARMWNDACTATEAAGEMSIVAPIGSYVDVAVSGRADQSAGPSNAVCVEVDGSDPVAYGLSIESFAHGLTYNDYLGLGVVTGSGTVFPPYYLAGPPPSDGWVEVFGSVSAQTGETACDQGFMIAPFSSTWQDEDLVQAGAGFTFVRNYRREGTLYDRENYILSSRGGGYSIQAQFSFGGIPFDVAGLLARIGQGATILSATAEVTFSGLLTYGEQVNEGFAQVAGGPGVAVWEQRTVNGVLYRDYDKAADGTVVTDYTNTDPGALDPVTTGASVSWVLMAVRLDSDDEIDVSGTPVEVPRNRYRAIGVGISADYDDGTSRIADLTDAIQALIDNRDRVSSSCFWWPTRGAASPGATPDSLAGYAQGLLPPASLDGETSPNKHERSFELSIQNTAWDSVSFGDLIVRYVDAEGALDRVVFPIIRPPAMPAPTP